jgi:environmental stress-induced protein Ves
MSVRIVAAGEARRMPWKNGRGMTLEVATDAPASDPAAWTWRLSIADVPERGPFSRFPGIDRSIACLAGEGLRLHRGRSVDEVPKHGVALAFAGEEEVDGEPRGRGVRDVNLMLRRGAWSGRLRVERSVGGSARGATVVIHAFTAGLAIEFEGVAYPLPPGATLVGTGGLRWSGEADAVAIVAEINREGPH